MADEYVGLKHFIKKSELIQIIAETLHALGHSKTAEQLEKEPELRVLFESQIILGLWDESIETLNETGIRDGANKNLAIQAINQQRVLEVNRRGKERNSELLRRRGDLRDELRRTLNLRPSNVPNTRLISLVEQALGQVDSGRLRVMEKIPSETLRVLHGHGDKVLFLSFSHSGEYLASSSADHSVIIWEVKSDGQVSSKLRLSEHQSPVSYVSWSPDDKQLLTCGTEETVRLWDIATGRRLATYGTEKFRPATYGTRNSRPGTGLVSCAWSLDGTTLFAGYNKNYGIEEWRQDERRDRSVEFSPLKEACKDLGIAADGETVITRIDDNTVLFLEWGRYVDNGLQNMRIGARRRMIEEDHEITSCTLSEDREFLLVSLVNGELHLWRINDVFNVVPELVATYKAPHLVTRSCFDGKEREYVACGSEDSKVYIWTRCAGQELIASLEGHYGAVNCVSWNPANPQMLASASDDGTIRIWAAAMEKHPPYDTRYDFEEKEKHKRFN